MNKKNVNICYKYLNEFISIYPKDNYGDDFKYVNKMPENVKLTVYCKSSNEEGFLINVKSDELGLEALIVQKWIIHSELEKLAGTLGRAGSSRPCRAGRGQSCRRPAWVSSWSPGCFWCPGRTARGSVCKETGCPPFSGRS